MSSQAAPLTIKAVSKQYGPTTVLDRVDLDIAAGELVTLLGPSGCGKTTLLRAIAGLVTPDSGSISIDGRDVTKLPPHKRQVGVVFQNYALFPHLSVAGNVAFGLRLKGMDAKAIAATVALYLELVHLSHVAERPISALSGGQQQRVALARALAVQPGVILFDEALSALDRNLREEMQVELRHLLRRIGTTAIFVTHDQDEALTMSDRIAVMYRGRIEQYTDPKTLYAAPASLFAMSFIGQSTQLHGEVLGNPAQGMVEIKTALGRLRAAANFAPGSSVVVAVRPECLQLGSAPSAESNAIAGRMTAAIFHGAHSMLHLAAEDGQRVVAQFSGGQGLPDEGSDVSLHWPVAQTFVYPAAEAA
ncbi:ABC transporter ATP-binding protein [Ferrovibrio sp. MS7]|uniref:ABC transporter ATP-binding protein n=1 Tax=Ferrovibrio plantarum TaxID=3119164 RepID=UPI003135AA64